MRLKQSLKNIREVEPIKNQKGYTLLIVMVIITLTVIFALGLSAIAMNTRLQVNKTENLNKATDLAEMGITFTSNAINASLDTINKDLAAEMSNIFGTNNGKPLDYNEILFFYNQMLKQKLQSFFTANPAFQEPVIVEGPNQFSILASESKINISDTNQFSVSFVSKGDTGSESRSISVTIPFTKVSSPAVSVPSGPGQSELIIKSKEIVPVMDTLKVTGTVDIGGNNQLVVRDDAYIGGLLTMAGTSDLFVGGDAIINSLILKGNVSVFIFGDAVLKTKIEEKDISGNALDLCILGNTYYEDGSGKRVLYDLGGLNKCSGNNGASEWRIDTAAGLDVNYNYN